MSKPCNGQGVFLRKDRSRSPLRGGDSWSSYGGSSKGRKGSSKGGSSWGKGSSDRNGSRKGGGKSEYGRSGKGGRKGGGKPEPESEGMLDNALDAYFGKTPEPIKDAGTNKEDPAKAADRQKRFGTTGGSKEDSSKADERKKRFNTAASEKAGDDDKAGDSAAKPNEEDEAKIAERRKRFGGAAGNDAPAAEGAVASEADADKIAERKKRFASANVKDDDKKTEDAARTACATKDCGFVVHSDETVGSGKYCCKACVKDGTHGKKCEKVAAKE